MPTLYKVRTAMFFHPPLRRAAPEQAQKMPIFTGTAKKIWGKLPPRIRLNLVRLTQQKFTVSAAIVIFNERREVLLLDHAMRPGNSWGLPGGFIKSGEQPDEAIRRELREETGIDVENLKLFRVRTLNRHVEILFSGKAVGEPKADGREIIDLGWFHIDELPKRIGISQKGLIESVLNEAV